VSEAVQAMNESAGEVDAGVDLANQSGWALTSLLQASEGSQRSGEEIASAAQEMNALANELVMTMNSLSQVVEESTSAMQEIATGSREMTQAIENIASVSQENSAAAEEVSASAEEMIAHVEEMTASAQFLTEMARTLNQLMNQFRLVEKAVEPNSKRNDHKMVATTRDNAEVHQDIKEDLLQDEAAERERYSI
jgi:methyl-accepting chemotaxis protein